jgi:hypothetical protein
MVQTPLLPVVLKWYNDVIPLDVNGSNSVAACGT